MLVPQHNFTHRQVLSIFSGNTSIMPKNKGGEKLKKANRAKVAAISAIAVFVIGLSTLGISQVYAQSNGNPISGLAQAIAQKFNLDAGQVQTTITDYRRQNRQDRMQKHLDQLVAQGKITQAQEQLILTEIANLNGKYNLNSLGTMTQQERKQALQNAHNEFKTWAQSQGISIPIFGRSFGRFNRIGW